MATLKKIIFENGEIGNTPINNENLNEIQDNTEMFVNSTKEELEEELEALWNDFKPNTVSGEIAIVNDGVKGSKVEIQGDGNSYQETTETSPSLEYKQDIEVITECSLVQRGKNYFNKDNANIVGGEFSESGFEEGQITSNKTCYVKIKPNKTITVSKVLSSKFAVATATDIPKNNVIPTTFIRKDSNIDITVTSGINDNYLWVWFWNKDNDTHILEDLLNSIQIEDGTENTDYEPYIEPIVHSIDLAGEKLAKVGEIADLLNIGVDGSCRINKNIKEKIFNGLEEFVNAENANGVRYFTNVDLIPDNASNDILCTHLKPIADLWNLTEQIDCIKVSANIKSQFNFMVKGFNDSSQLIAKLKELYDNETPMKLLYATTTPTTISLPLIEPITLFEGTNVFELVTNLGTTLSVTYKVSNNSRLDKLEQALLSLNAAEE